MGIIGFAVGIPLIAYVVSPALTRREKTWVDVGGVNEVSVDEPSQLEYIATIRDGYVETKTQTDRLPPFLQCARTSDAGIHGIEGISISNVPATAVCSMPRGMS